MITIVGGIFRGRKITVPEGTKVRPTSNRVREGIFNVLQHWIDLRQTAVVDLYAGSGALGMEALSRGAFHALFIEKSSKHMRLLKQNLVLLQLPSTQVTIVCRSASAWLPSFHIDAELGESQCLIFLDPPYHAGEYETILPMVGRLANIPQETIIVVESPTSLKLPSVDNLETFQSKRYGSTQIDFLMKK